MIGIHTALTMRRLSAAPSCILAGLTAAAMMLSTPSLAQIQTTISPALPNISLGDTTKADDKTGAEATYCRPPQHRTDSRLPGPRVCMPVRKWNDLHAAGLDIGPDGVSTVPMQKNTDILSH